MSCELPKLSQKRIPKLMAPINSFDGGMKVVDAGADEVYCAVQISELKDFVLYRGASSELPTYSEFGKIVKYAHNHGVKVPLVINWPYMVETIEKPIKKHISRCIAEGADALIIGDLGILAIIKDMKLNVPLYASTYMISMNSKAVAFLEKVGFKRVILERHLTLSEVSKIVEKSNIGIEVLIHGGGCSNINGSCHLYHYHVYYNSAKLQNALRQSLAGTPCAIKFNLYNVRNIEEKFENVPVMDAFGYCSICNLPDLVRTGVESLKIEGRTSTTWYQIATTTVYRELLNLLAQGQTEAYKKRVDELKTGMPVSDPTPTGFCTHKEIFCDLGRCYFSPLTHVPYDIPVSWQTWTKQHFKLVVQK